MARTYCLGSPLVAAVLAISTAFSPIADAARPAAAAVTPGAIAAGVNSYFSGLAQANKFSGAVLLAQDNTILLGKGYGMANWASPLHNTTSTVFLAPNLLLEFGVTATLQLMDAGKLRDGDHLCAYIPHCPVTWAPITIHEVLTNDAGLHDFLNDASNTGLPGKPSSLAKDITVIESEPLDFKPGTRGRVSYNAALLIEEYLVEHVTGQSFTTYVRQHFLTPLGLTHTGYYFHLAPITQHAIDYQNWKVPEPNTLSTYRARTGFTTPSANSGGQSAPGSCSATWRILSCDRPSRPR